MGGKLHNFRNKTYSCHLLCIWFNSNLFAEFQKDIDGDYLFTMANLFSTLSGDERLQQGWRLWKLCCGNYRNYRNFPDEFNRNGQYYNLIIFSSSGLSWRKLNILTFWGQVYSFYPERRTVNRRRKQKAVVKQTALFHYKTADSISEKHNKNTQD